MIVVHVTNPHGKTIQNNTIDYNSTADRQRFGHDCRRWLEDGCTITTRPVADTNTGTPRSMGFTPMTRAGYTGRRR
jgi:hypothetical protein